MSANYTEGTSERLDCVRRNMESIVNCNIIKICMKILTPEVGKSSTGLASWGYGGA